MNGPSPRHGSRFSKAPPFLLPGLLVVIVILSFNYWRTSRLNKELLESVSVSQAKSHKLDNDLQSSVKSLQDLEKQLSQLKDSSESTRISAEKAKSDMTLKLSQERDLVDTLQAAKKELQANNDALNRELNELKQKFEDTGKLNMTIAELRSSNVAMSANAAKKTRDNYIIMAYVAEELGRPGMEHLISHSVQMPENVTMPPADQQPMCAKRAEELYRQQHPQLQMVSKEELNKSLQSPNVGKTGEGEETDVGDGSNHGSVDLTVQDQNIKTDGVASGNEAEKDAPSDTDVGNSNAGVADAGQEIPSDANAPDVKPNDGDTNNAEGDETQAIKTLSLGTNDEDEGQKKDLPLGGDDGDMTTGVVNPIDTVDNDNNNDDDDEYDDSDTYNNAQVQKATQAVEGVVNIGEGEKNNDDKQPMETTPVPFEETPAVDANPTARPMA